MKIIQDEQAKRVEIWVDGSEQPGYKQQDAYKQVVERYKNTHTICVYVGGSKPLLPTITTLLDAQVRPKLAKVG